MWTRPVFRLAFAPESDAPDLDDAGSPLLLSGLLTLLRWLTAGVATATLGTLAQLTNRPWPWQNPLTGTLILVYILGAGLLFLLMALLPRRPLWLIDVSFGLDFAVLGLLSLTSGGATARGRGNPPRLPRV